MPWIKATPRMGGTFDFSMDDISRGKVYKTAEDEDIAAIRQLEDDVIAEFNKG